MSDKLFLLILFILPFCAPDAQGQDYLTELSTYTQKDGLSSRFIKWVYEDSRGFVWVSTDNGLNRFDGHDFKVFNKENSNLFLDRCMMVYEDVNGNIWVAYQTTGSSDVLGWRSIITPDFEIIDLDDFFKNELPFSAKEIRRIREAPQKTLIITTNDGAIYKYDGTFQKIAEDESLKNSNFLHLDSSGNVYFLSDNSLLIAKTGKETQSFKTPGVNYLPVLKDSKIYWYNYQDLKDTPTKAKMFSSIDTLDLLPPDFFKNDEKLSFKNLIPHYSFISFCFKYEDLLKKYDPETGEIAIVSKELLEDYPETYMQAGRFSRKSKYWFWNLEGLNLLTFKPNPFECYLKGISQSTRAIFKVDEDRFSVAPRTPYFNRKTEEIRQVTNLQFPPTRSFVGLKDDKLLMGDYGNKIHIYDLKTDTYELISLKEKDKSNFIGKGFLVPFEDDASNIWIGTDNGIVEFNRGVDSLEIFRNYNEFQGLSKERISYFHEYKDGIWGASTKGLFLLKPNEGIVAWHQPLPDLRVEHFLREGDVFWLATYGEGLVKWNSRTGAVKKYGIENGLLDEHLMAVYPDENENLWMTSNWGLARFNRQTETFNVFLKSDGINHNEFNISSHFQDEDGKLYFGGLDGITAFDPNNFSDNEKDTLAKFVLTGYEEVDAKYNFTIDKTTDFLNKKSIDIAPDVKTFVLKFALLNYENTDFTRYAHKIEGLDKDWIFEKENYLKLSRLPFGEYNLRLKAIDYHGNEYNELAVPLKIIAPFYRQTIWQLFGLLLFGALIFYAFKRRENYLLFKQESLEQLVNERTSELRSLNETKDRLFAILAHDLRNPVIAFEELSETINYLIQKNDPEQLSKLGSQVELEAKQLHHLLDNLLNWALTQRKEVPIELSYFNLKSFLEEMTQVFGGLAKSEEIKISIECDENVEIKTDRRLLEIVSRNILTNAFRYTKKGGNVNVFVKKQNERILINYKDDGDGMTDKELENLFDVKRKFRSKGNTSTVSLGMHLSKEILELVEGDISAKAQLGEGTLVTIKLPIRTFDN